MNDAGKLQRGLSGELNNGAVSLSGEFDNIGIPAKAGIQDYEVRNGPDPGPSLEPLR